MSDTKIAQALDRLAFEMRTVSRQLEALTSEIKRLHHAIDRATGEVQHSSKSTQTLEEKRKAFDLYLGGSPDAS